MIAGAAWLAAASALSAQTGTAPRRGDVDGDGQVTVTDARIVSDYLVGRQVPAGANVAERGDVNGDGRVTSVDAAIIRAAAAGRDVSRFKVGAPVGNGEVPANALAALTCSANVRSRTVSCDLPGGPADGARGVVIGGQNLNVKLTSSNVQVDTTAGIIDFTFDVRVKNLIAQRLGTTDGTTVDPAAIRVFFSQSPTVVGPDSGSIELVGTAGDSTFTASNQPYYAYPLTVPLDSGQVTDPVNWHFRMPTSVNFFQFKVFVWTPLQYPDGWVAISPPTHLGSTPYYPGYASYPPTDTVSRDPQAPNYAPLTLSAIPRTRMGRDPDSMKVTWSSSDSAVAVPTATTPSGASANLALAADGNVTITASNRSTEGADSVPGHARSGQVNFVVRSADSTTSTITAAPGVLPAGDTSVITVQLKNSAGVNLTQSGGTVDLFANHGTITAVTNNHDGTYTARVTTDSALAVTVTGKLNNHTLVDTAVVTFTAGAPNTMAANPPSSQNQSGTVGAAVGTPPSVKVTDAHGNPVSGVAVTFTAPAGNGQVSNGGPASTSAIVNTDGSGVATLTSWTLGTVAKVDSVTATAGALTPVLFTATANPGAPANMVKSAGDAQNATVNTNVVVAPAVTITDTYGNVVPNVSVTFAVASGGGSVTGGAATTNASGVATVGSWKLGQTAGANTLDASSTGLTTVTFSATGTPDVPATITKTSTDPQNGAAGSPVGSAPTVHVVDQYGNAVPSVSITFAVTGGGGSVTGGTPTTNASGNATVGSWTLGSGPTTNTLSASATPAGTSSPVTFTAYIPPVAAVDSSQAMGNTTLASNVAPNLLTNDVTINGGSLTVTSASPIATVRGGTITLTDNLGGFTYLPAAGVTGRDSAQYTINDGHLSAMGWVKFRFVGKVWYVDNTFVGTATGRDVSPYTSISAAEAVAVANDSILVRTGSGVTAGGTLKNGQLLRGQGQNAAFTTTLNGTSVTLLPTGTAPQVGSLTLGSGNSLRGLRVVSTGTGLLGASVGTLSLGELAINATNGAALDLSNGTVTGNGGSGTAVLDSVKSTNSTGSGISLATIAGTLTINGGTASAITNPTGSAVNISGGSVAFSFPGTISKTNAAGTGINLSSASGNVSFTGPSIVLSTGSSNGINLSSASGTVSFVDSVKVTTTSGTGISAANSGTLTIAGTHNTINSTAGVALNVSSTTIGAAGLNFRRIDASGAGNGIFLSSTGTLGGLTVTGDGSTNGSGGTIANSTGGDGATAGNGVYLSSARKVSLSWMSLSGHQNHAVYGTSARDVDLNHVRITGNNGTSNSGTFQEGAVHFVNATGGITVKNSRLDGSAYTAFLVEQLSGAPAADSIVAAFDTISTGQGSTSDVRGNGLQTIVSSGSVNVRYRSNSVTYWWGNGIQVAVQNTAASSTALIQNNKVNQTSGALGASSGIEVNGGPLAFNISGNNITGADGTAISADKNQGNTFFNGTIDGNTVGTPGVANSGSATGTGIFVQHAGPNATTVKVSNNTIRQINGSQAIWFLLGDDTGGGGSGTMNVTVTGNNIAEEGTAASARTGIVVQSGRVAGDTDTMCADVQSNSITNFNNRIRPNERFLTSMRVRGYTGANNDNTAMQNYLTTLNPGTVNVASNNVSAGGPGFLNTSPAGSACPQPTM